MTYPRGMSPYELALWFTEKLGDDSEMERRNWIAAWWNLYLITVRYSGTWPLLKEFR